MKLSFKFIFGLVIGIAGLFLAFSAGSAMWGIFFPEPLELTESSMDRLNVVISNLEEGQNTTMLFYLEKGFYLVGFDKGSDSGPVYLRPEQCFETFCLLICSNSGNERSCLDANYGISPNSIVSFTSENVGGVILSETGEYITLYLEKQGSALLIEKLNS